MLSKASATHVPVYLIFNFNQYELKMATSEKIPLKDFDKIWDKNKGRYKRNYSEALRANFYFDKLLSDVSNIYQDFRRDNIIPTPSMIRQRILPERSDKEKKLDFFALFDEFIEHKSLEGVKDETIRYYKNKRSLFLAHHKVVGFCVEDYTDRRHESFVASLMASRDYHPNTIGSNNKTLRAFFNFCKNHRGIKLSDNHAKIKKVQISGDRIHLSEHEVLAMAMLDDLPHHLDVARDLYLFGCYTSLRYSDLTTLKQSNIKKLPNGMKAIRFYARKTTTTSFGSKAKVNSFNEIVLTDKAQLLLNKYSNHGGAYLFPVSTIQEANRHIKKVAQMAGINQFVEKIVFVAGQPKTIKVPKWQLVTMHTSRHTFAVLSIGRNMNPVVLQKILGHTEFDTTAIYLNMTAEESRVAMIKAWGK